MSALMDLFDGELAKFCDDCSEDEMTVVFDGNAYPQKIVIRGNEVWEQQSFDGIQPTKKKQPEIIVAGDLNGTVCVHDVQMRKKGPDEAGRKGRKAAGAVSARILPEHHGRKKTGGVIRHTRP